MSASHKTMKIIDHGSLCSLAQGVTTVAMASWPLTAIAAGMVVNHYCRELKEVSELHDIAEARLRPYVDNALHIAKVAYDWVAPESNEQDL